jgi:hypothetical protein
VNPNLHLTQCCVCLNLTEISYEVQYCKYCGHGFCKDCLDFPYLGPETNRSNWECCLCAGLTEENGHQGDGVEYCRFCGKQLCDFCGLFQVFFEDGEFSTSYIWPRTRPPDDQESPQVPRRRRRSPVQSRPPQGDVDQGDIDPEGIFQMELDDVEAKESKMEEITDGETKQSPRDPSDDDSREHEPSSGNLVSVFSLLPHTRLTKLLCRHCNDPSAIMFALTKY